MDDEARKIGMLIAAFDEEHARLQSAIEALSRSGTQLRLEVKSAAREAVDTALAGLHPHIDRAGKTLVDIQRISLWRATWQHVMVAVVAIAITLLAVWWYVPPLSEISRLQTERDQLQASIEGLNKRGARMKLFGCGPTKRLCVLVDRTAGTFGVDGNKEDLYMIAKGY
ncbi:MAG: hypothetical protein ABI145_02485 [Steroidobacteraceae bacterium]